jgi:hypothetical protein
MKKQIKKETPTGLLEINISTERGFSITADFFENRHRPAGNNSPRRWVAGGCLHDEILQVCPELKPFVDLHLSNLDGVPMHALENGFYWLAKVAGIPQEYGPDQEKETCFSYLCNHLRVDSVDGARIVEACMGIYQQGKNAKDHFSKIVESMKPRWKAEAESAISLLEKL